MVVGLARQRREAIVMLALVFVLLWPAVAFGDEFAFNPSGVIDVPFGSPIGFGAPSGQIVQAVVYADPVPGRTATLLESFDALLLTSAAGVDNWTLDWSKLPRTSCRVQVDLYSADRDLLHPLYAALFVITGCQLPIVSCCDTETPPVPSTPIPEPSTWALLTTGLIAAVKKVRG